MDALLLIIFLAGYALIAFESKVRINKAAVALITGVLCWTVLIAFTPQTEWVNAQLAHHLGELSGILFFLLGAMTVVELIDAHDGFDLITNRITTTSLSRLLWIIGLLSFFLSAVLDNLTATIVMISLLRKLLRRDENRLLFCGLVVIAANAGGAWSPIGDVTTTMLWIGGQLSTMTMIKMLILPSLVCLLVPLLLLTAKVKGTVVRPVAGEDTLRSDLSARQQAIVFICGVGVLLFVPVFKTLTHLPPYMGMLLGLGILWVITELLHGRKDEEDKHKLSVVYALRKIDAPSILFFFGILVSISALQSAGLLSRLSVWLSQELQSDAWIALSLGILSAIVDNVPLVAAAQGMYGLAVYPTDHFFWQFLAYCTGTGGSLLIIGSAAGVAAMGLEDIRFGWYLRRISWLALAGLLGGAGVFLLQSSLG